MTTINITLRLKNSIKQKFLFYLCICSFYTFNAKRLLTFSQTKCIVCILNIHTIVGGCHVNIIISNADGRPIYEQIYEAVKSSVISGELKSGETLPSIRNLAKDLRISVITTKRAYDELEKDGFIYSVTGKGSFVAEKNIELVRETHLKEIEEYMKKILFLSKNLDISQQQIIEMFNILSKED